MGWTRFFRRQWWDDERSRELESYIEIETDDNIARGMTPDEARAAARRKLGQTGSIREEIYTMNSINPLEWLVQDVRYASRVLRRNRGFSLAAMFTLALGIGGVTVIYSALRNILLDPFPYAESDRMVNVHVIDVETGRGHNGARMTDDEFLDFSEAQSVLEYSVASSDFREMMRRDGGAEIVRLTYMTPNTFPYLGVTPFLGRVFTDDDARPDAPPVVVLAYGAWNRMFGGDRSVIGQVVTIGDTQRTIIGVMPDRFAWQAPDMWVPHALHHGGVVRPDGQQWSWAYQGRIKSGVTLERAAAEMTAIVQRRALQFPDKYPQRLRVDVLDLRYKVVNRFAVVLYTLLAAVSLLLLIACCNVANMLLARATTREREMTLRVALGGGRLRLMAQLLTEAGLLALGGAIGGVLLAWAGIRAIAAILPRQNVAWEVQLRLVPEALVASLVLAVLTTLIVGTVPAWHASRQDLAGGMKESGKGAGASHKHGWFRQALVVAEVALSLVLLLGAGVLIQRFVALLDTGFGVDTSRLAAVRPRFDKVDEPGLAQRHQYYADVLARVRTVSGVTDVALASDIIGGRPLVANRLGSEPPSRTRRVTGNFCNETYLGLLGLPALRGRTLTSADISDAAQVVVISQSLADEYFGGEDPLGQYLELPDLTRPPVAMTDVAFRVVGIVADVRNQGPTEPAWPSLYLPTTLTALGNTPREIVVKTAGDPMLVVPALERAVRDMDPNVAVVDAYGLDNQWRTWFFAQPRFFLTILSTFATIGLLLVAVGVYGVMAYAVSRRAQEFAIRMALGATGNDVLQAVVRSGAVLLVVGVVVGLVMSRVTNRLISSFDPSIVGTESTWSAVIAVLVIVVVGVVACLIPAARAARTNPMQALRAE